MALSQPTRLCVGTLRTNCRPIDEARQMLAKQSLTIVHAAPPPGGAQRSTVLTLRSSDGVVFDAKWRAMTSASPDNDPTGGLAADRLQTLVLDPDDSVIPPAAPHCFSREEHRRYLHHETSPPGETGCVLGTLSLWLSDAIGLDEARRTVLAGEPGTGDPQLFDHERFQRDPIYRRNVANLNVLAYLMQHGDAHAGQFVAYAEPLHVFLVDNSVAFGLDHRTAMDDRQDLARLIVHAIPADTAARLRGLTDLSSLRVLAELRSTDGEAEPAPPSAPFGHPEARVRRSGDRIQFGLKPSQIAGIRERLGALRARLEDGSLGTFD